MLVYLAMGEAPFSQSIVKGISNILDKVIFFYVDLLLVFDFCNWSIISVRFINKGRPFLIAIEDPQVGCRF